MLDSIHHMTLKLLKIAFFAVKKSRFCHHLRNVIMDVITLVCKPLVVYLFYCMTLYHSQRRRHLIKKLFLQAQCPDFVSACQKNIKIFKAVSEL